MSQYTKSFIWRVIVHIIVLGIIGTILSRVLTGFLVTSVEFPGTTVCYPIILTEALFNVAVIMLSAYLSQKVIFKRGCYSYPQSISKVYWIFTLVIICVNILLTILGFAGTYDICYTNIDKFKMLADILTDNPDIAAEKAGQMIRDRLLDTMRPVLMISNAMQAAAMCAFTPLLIKKYHAIS
ncbi:MAG: hypothetical protein QM689_07275 [Oscillospiraceae bacterium]